jgi:hypothetical protein
MKCAVLIVAAALVAAPAAGAADVPAVPRAVCGPGSLPEPGLQGRVAKADVDSGEAADGYRCNTRVVGHSGKTGGFKVLRYVDPAGHECAYYDTTLLFPTNTLTLSAEPTGVAVLDMSNPAKPVPTATLSTPAMQTPHESLNISTRRGILAAVAGNPSAGPGVVDVYDISRDCRHPELKSSSPVGFLGHESGMAPDGRTFYATSLGTGQTTAVDITNPSLPYTIGTYEFNAHGMTVSDDGTRGYMAAKPGVTTVDLTQVQQRKVHPRIPVISRLTWPNVTVPQVAQPFAVDGHPYLAEVDEYSGDDKGGAPNANGPRVGAARILDIADERHPRVIANVRLQVHQRVHRGEIAGDYGAQNPTQGYAAHYCSVPTRVNPTIMACSMILSGLRVFDIRDPAHPREIAYFVAPPDTVSLTGGPVADEKANWAMSQPAFAPGRNEIWYSDGESGFWAIRLSNGAWPAWTCRTTLRLPRIRGRRIVRALARVGGRVVARRRGRNVRSLTFARRAISRRARVRLIMRGHRGRTWARVVTRQLATCD